MTYRPALKKVYEILQKTHRHTLKSQRLTAVLPSPPGLAFRNAKTLKDHLVRSKLKITYEKPGVTICGRKNCEICHILHQGDIFESSNTGKQYKINFLFNCNSRNVVYLLTCKICEKQYVGSTVSKFRSRFNQCKCNINLCGKGQRSFMQEPLIDHFFSNKHNGSHKDIKCGLLTIATQTTQNVEKISGFITWILFFHEGLIRENWYYDSDYCLMNFVL